MDAAQLREQVQDVVRLLASKDPNLYAAVKRHYAPDAVLELPIHQVQGPEKIQEIVALHATFTTDNTVGDVKWNEETKTATFAAKTTYCLPLSGGRIKFTVQWQDVTLKLAPDNNHPAPSHTAEPTKYHITKVSKAPQPPRHRILAAPYHIFIFLVRLVAPYVMGILVTVHKFFQRNPISNGIIRTSFAAVRELLQWIFSIILSYLPFSVKHRIGTVVEHKTPPTVDVPESPRKAPDVDLHADDTAKRSEKSTAPEPKNKTVEKLETKSFNIDNPAIDVHVDVLEKVKERVPEPKAKEEEPKHVDTEEKSYAEAVEENLPEHQRAEEKSTAEVVEGKSYADAAEEGVEHTSAQEHSAEVVEGKSYADAAEEAVEHEHKSHPEAAQEHSAEVVEGKSYADAAEEAVEHKSYAEAAEEALEPKEAPEPKPNAADALHPVKTASSASPSESTSAADSPTTAGANGNGAHKKNKKKKHTKKHSKH